MHELLNGSEISFYLNLSFSFKQPVQFGWPDMDKMDYKTFIITIMMIGLLKLNIISEQFEWRCLIDFK